MPLSRYILLAACALIAFSTIGVALSTAASLHPAGGSDQKLADALAVHHSDVPAYWDSTIIPDPCPRTPYLPSIRVTAHASSRWGSPTHGLWSTVLVATSEQNAQLLAEHVAAVVPRCRAAALQKGVTSGGVRTVIGSASYGRLGDSTRAWTLTETRRGANGRRIHEFALDIVVVRYRTAVAWYTLGTFSHAMSHRIVSRAVHRAALTQ